MRADPEDERSYDLDLLAAYARGRIAGAKIIGRRWLGRRRPVALAGAMKARRHGCHRV